MINYTICSIIKDERHGLDEWINYHLNLGFEKIFLFEDFNSCRHNDIIQKYNNEKEQVVLQRLEDIDYFGDYKDNPRRRIELFNWFIKNQCSDIDWCAFIDIDEFIHINENYSLSKICKYLYNPDDVKSLSLSQKFFNCSNILRFQDSVIESYNQTFDINDCIFNGRPITEDIFSNYYFKYQFKQLVHVSLTKNNDIHFIDNVNKYPNFSDTRNLIGHDLMANSLYEIIWIDHYYTKSLDDFICKLKRGTIENNNPIKEEGLDIFFKANKQFDGISRFICDQIKSVYNIGSNKVISKRYYLTTSMDDMIFREYENSPKHAILFICHDISYENMNRYFELYKNLPKDNSYDLYWAYEGTELPEEYYKFRLSDFSKIFKFFLFKFTDLQKKYGQYNYGLMKMVKDQKTNSYKYVPSLPNCNYIVMDFLSKYKEYNYCWGIEYDVIHTSNWEGFFEYWYNSNSDFISSNIYLMKPEQYSTLKFITVFNTQDNDIYESFNPVFRLSRKASELFEKYHKDNIGFYESIMPTLCLKYGLTVEDMGGDGPFVKKENINRFYLNLSTIINLGTMGFHYFTQEEYAFFKRKYPGILLHCCKPNQVQLINESLFLEELKTNMLKQSI